MRNIISSILYLLFFIAIILRPGAQEMEVAESHEEILENLLKFNIVVEVCPDKKGGKWDFESTKLTIPGKAITLKLEGKEIKIYGIFTPYNSKGKLMLLAQSQVILFPGSDSRIKYYNSFKTLSITLGETILFLPLGHKEEKKNTEKNTGNEDCDIIIKLEIVRYKEQKKPSTPLEMPDVKKPPPKNLDEKIQTAPPPEKENSEKADEKKPPKHPA